MHEFWVHFIKVISFLFLSTNAFIKFVEEKYIHIHYKLGF